MKTIFMNLGTEEGIKKAEKQKGIYENMGLKFIGSKQIGFCRFVYFYGGAEE